MGPKITEIGPRGDAATDAYERDLAHEMDEDQEDLF